MVTLLSFSLMMYNFHWSWKTCIIISNSLSIVIQIIFYLTEPGNILWLLTFSLLTGSKFLTYLWLPYYFGKIGYEEYAASISFVYLFVTPFASLLFNSVSRGVSMSEEYLVCIFLVFSVGGLSVLSFFMNDESAIWIYIVMLIVVSMSQGGPRMFFGSTEIRKRAP